LLWSPDEQPPTPSTTIRTSPTVIGRDTKSLPHQELSGTKPHTDTDRRTQTQPTDPSSGPALNPRRHPTNPARPGRCPLAPSSA
jgi:hypothetical protein